MKSIIIAASGNGSNFEAIVKKFEEWELPVSIEFLFSDNRDAFALKRAKKLGIKSIVIDYRETGDSRVFNNKLANLLCDASPSLIVLAGYMRIIPDFIVDKFDKRIINIHPSLLPAFPGTHAIEKAYKKGVKFTGITIHYVDKGVDTGPIIQQKCIKIKSGESLKDLERRIHRIEHLTYPAVLRDILFKGKNKY